MTDHMALLTLGFFGWAGLFDAAILDCLLWHPDGPVAAGRWMAGRSYHDGFSALSVHVGFGLSPGGYQGNQKGDLCV